MPVLWKETEFTGDDIIKVNESMLNENKLADYLLTIIEDEDKSIFEDELETDEPETDSMGNIVNDYGERFLYVTKDLKKIVKMKANAIANMVKTKGIEVSPFYIENELFQALRLYGPDYCLSKDRCGGLPVRPVCPVSE